MCVNASLQRRNLSLPQVLQHHGLCLVAHKGCTPPQKAEEGLRTMEAQWEELCAEATETQRCNAEKIVNETVRVDRARELLEKEETSTAPVDNSHELQCVCTKALWNSFVT